MPEFRVLGFTALMGSSHVSNKAFARLAFQTLQPARENLSFELPGSDFRGIIEYHRQAIDKLRQALRLL